MLTATTPAFKANKAAAPVGNRAHRTYRGRLVVPGFLGRNDQAIAARVADRIYPAPLPQDVEMPAITYSRDGTQDLATLDDGQAGLRGADIQVDAWADDYQAARALAANIFGLGKTNPLVDATDFEYAEWRHAKPGIDYHVEVDKRFYSVPHALIGQVLDPAHHRDHHRGHAQGQAGRQPCPSWPGALQHRDRPYAQVPSGPPGRFLNWAADIGPCTAQVVRQQLENRPHPEYGYRACLGLLRLARRYDHAHPEKACERALAIRSASYHSVASILQQGLDRLPPEDKVGTQEELPLHGNVRGAGYYH